MSSSFGEDVNERSLDRPIMTQTMGQGAETMRADYIIVGAGSTLLHGCNTNGP